jgi:hypothetical protein
MRPWRQWAPVNLLVLYSCLTAWHLCQAALGVNGRGHRGGRDTVITQQLGDTWILLGKWVFAAGLVEA